MHVSYAMEGDTIYLDITSLIVDLLETGSLRTAYDVLDKK